MCLKENSKNIEHKTEDEIKLKQKLIEYELVRTQGNYNMLDEKARSMIGLSQADYMYIIEHYGELMNKYPDTKKQVQLRLDYIKLAEIAKLIAIKGCNNCIKEVWKKLDISVDDLCEQCKINLEPYINSYL